VQHFRPATISRTQPKTAEFIHWPPSPRRPARPAFTRLLRYVYAIPAPRRTAQDDLARARRRCLLAIVVSAAASATVRSATCPLLKSAVPSSLEAKNTGHSGSASGHW